MDVWVCVCEWGVGLCLGCLREGGGVGLSACCELENGGMVFPCLGCVDRVVSGRWIR